MNATQAVQLHALFQSAFNARDTSGLLALYEPDAAFVPQPGQVLRGGPAIGSTLQQFLALDGQLQLETIYAVEAGDLALLRGQFRIQDGQSVKAAGKTVEVARRQADGRWLFAIDHPGGAE